MAEPWIHDFASGLGPENWQRHVAEEPNLFENGSLIPVNVFMGKLPFSKSDNGYQRHFDTPVRGGNAGQHPGHVLCVSKREDHFIDKLILADRSRNRGERCVRRHTRNEVPRIESA